MGFVKNFLSLFAKKKVAFPAVEPTMFVSKFVSRTAAAVGTRAASTEATFTVRDFKLHKLEQGPSTEVTGTQRIHRIRRQTWKKTAMIIPFWNLNSRGDNAEEEISSLLFPCSPRFLVLTVSRRMSQFYDFASKQIERCRMTFHFFARIASVLWKWLIFGMFVITVWEKSIDRLIDCSFVRCIDRLIDRLIDWLID